MGLMNMTTEAAFVESGMGSYYYYLSCKDCAVYLLRMDLEGLQFGREDEKKLHFPC